MARNASAMELRLSSFVALVLVVANLCQGVALEADARSAGYDELYADGLSAYYKDEWPTAVAKIEEAIKDWQRERNVTVTCRTECQDALAAEGRKSSAFAVEFFISLNHMRSCADACIKVNLGVRYKISKHVRSLFNNRAPFGFLQFAYHKVGNNVMAVRAASTFLRFNPKDTTMNENMKFYETLPEITEEDSNANLAPVMHHELYERGRKAYNEQKWQETVDIFEEALKEYLKAYKECQTLCDVRLESTQQYIAGGVYGYHVHLLLCRLDCPRKLSMVFNYPQPGHLSKYFDFLHYSYNRINRIDEAMECAVTFLLLNPKSEYMKNNFDYYIKKGYSISDVKPREDGQYLFEDIKNQMELLENAKSYLVDLDEEYRGSEDLEDTTYKTYLAHGLYPDESFPETEEEEKEKEEKEEKEEEEKEKADEEKAVEDEPYKRFELPSKEHIENFLKDFEGASLTMMEQQLNGSYRVVIDGLATQEECNKLMHLGLSIGHAGDGYHNRPSPHTKKELFLGVEMKNATWAAAKGEIPLEVAELYVNLSEKVRQVTEAYFKLTTPLYFTYTHLVCRKAISDQEDQALHISHPVHSDNCVLKDGEVVTCVKEHPAYTWRDYSAILYFNNNFTGGQFIFASSNQTIEAIVEPKCGRMVAFSAGFENLHGVLGIKQGTRCALPLWFTLDKAHDEKQRHDADEILRTLRKNKDSDDNSEDNGHREL